MNTDGFDALWCTSDGSADKEQRCLDFLEEQLVSGVIIAPVGLDPGASPNCATAASSVVLLDRRADAGVCSVRVSTTSRAARSRWDTCSTATTAGWYSSPARCGQGRSRTATRAP